MAVKMRLQRKGRRKRPFYHIVVADSRAPRDGKYIERIGTYNPMTKPATINLDRDKAFEWLMKGAQPTDTVRAILRFKGVLYRKHLMRGVKKGALTLEQAEQMYQEYIQAKDAKIAARFEAAAEERRAWHQAISGEAPAPAKAEEPAAEEAAAEAPAEQTAAEAPAEEAPAAEAEAPAEEAAPESAEAPAEEEETKTEE
ncbi:MAG: 30S ribosomal protein S16 [Bacteroidetes bacterium]|nr:MAG: 30S ribosomal protein S16 [Bacteroidota bacterium]